MKALAAFIVLELLALSVVAWYLVDGTRAAPTAIPTSPAATATPESSFPQHPDPQDRVYPSEPAITPKPIAGIPAIVPTNPDAPAAEPTFDAATAADYTLARPSYTFNFVPNGPVTVASVQFLWGSQLDELRIMGGSLAQPDRLFCAVILASDFTAPAADLGNPGPLGQLTRLTRIFVLFDARTGNELGMGGLNR